MGTGNKASDAAAAADAQRQASIASSVNQIQSAYSNPTRAAQIDQYGNALNSYYTGQVNNQEQVNARDLKFANARSGLTGGSEAVDSNNQLQKDYTNGLVQAASQANAGKAALSTADQNSENQLVSLAQAGNYTGAIPQQVAQSQTANLNAASNYAGANTLNNIFSGTAGIYQSEQTAAANRNAQVNPIGSIYGTNSIFGGTVMGSFFHGTRTGSIGGSSANNDVMNDPIHQFIFGKQQEVLPTAGPYAGVAPTLAAAQRGYATGPAGQAAPVTGTSAQLQATGLGQELAPPAAAPGVAIRPQMGAPMRPQVGNTGGIYGY